MGAWEQVGGCDERGWVSGSGASRVDGNSFVHVSDWHHCELKSWEDEVIDVGAGLDIRRVGRVFGGGVQGVDTASFL